jgi:LPXTG-motif cell wall-anchored protein
MKKLRLVAVAAIMGGIAIFAAAPAQAYPDVVVVLTADSPVIGGKTVHFTADTTAHNVQCDWTVTFSDGVANGENAVRTGHGLSLSGSYHSKPVSKKTPTTMTAECLYDNAAAPVVAKISSSNAVTPALYTGKATTLQSAIVPATPDSVTVILLPVGGEDNGSLPDTGGSNISWLFIGGALVLAGGGVTYAARRRHSAH